MFLHKFKNSNYNIILESKTALWVGSLHLFFLLLFFYKKQIPVVSSWAVIERTCISGLNRLQLTVCEGEFFPQTFFSGSPDRSNFLVYSSSLSRGSVSAIDQVPLTATPGLQNAGNPWAYDNAFQTCAAHSSIEPMTFRGRARRRNKNQETGEKLMLTLWCCQPD